jgi:hypothetical protein
VLTLSLAGLFLWALIYDHHLNTVRLEMAFPTLGSILVLADFFLWFFSGAAFFLDRYRIPVLTTVLAVIFIPKVVAPPVSELLARHNYPWLAQVFDSDHYDTVRKLDRPVDLNSIPTPARVLQLRVTDSDQPYIIVTASGGGIQAAERTSQILATLEADFAEDSQLRSAHYTFHDHLLLASGVSGGSVGLMPFLLEYTARDDAHPGTTFFPAQPPAQVPSQPSLADRITAPTGCSSLEAVGWGLSYHDIYRLITPIRIPGGLDVDTEPDRSWALAAAFNRNLNDIHCKSNRELFTGLPPISDGNGLTLKSSADLLAKGALPAFTFNTTAAETGSRFLLSDYWVPDPSTGINLPPGYGPNPLNDFIPAESFLQAYASDGHPYGNISGRPLLHADLPLATAARLSATFPIVSSGTRIPPAYTAHAYHFLDGGYFDNDGTASVIEFLKSALPKPALVASPQPSKKLKLLLIEIRDDDGKEVTTDSDDLAHQNANVDDTNELQAPPWTPITQLTGIAEGLWNAGHVSIARRNRRELCVFEEAHPDVEIHHIVFTIPSGTDNISPLSWSLTSGQLASITSRVATEETKAAIAASIRWVKNIRLKSDDPELGLCKAWVEPSSSTFIKLIGQ